MQTSKAWKFDGSSVSTFQLMVGLTLAVAGVAAILRLSGLWTMTDVRYSEYSLVLLWGVLLIVGALRNR